MKKIVETYAILIAACHIGCTADQTGTNGSGGKGGGESSSSSSSSSGMGGAGGMGASSSSSGMGGAGGMGSASSSSGMGGAGGGSLGQKSLARPSDPVVFLGNQLGALKGSPPNDLVAFRYSSAMGAWTQVPVQVDERRAQTARDCYNSTAYDPLPLTEYADSNTWVGADPDPNIDDDDEIALMAFDSGDEAPAGAPANVLGPGVEVVVTDPVNGTVGWVYLFRRANATLQSSAGKQYVTYDFRFGANGQYSPADYRNFYNLDGGTVENSEIIGRDDGANPVYRTHFSMKWIRDDLQIQKGGASGVDILDADQAEWNGGTCSRSIATFSNARSCFFINKSGPVRALRQYMGANSGAYMVRTHEFYRSLEVNRVNFRLHDGVGIQSYMDHNANAYGMTYYNDATQAGVPVNGTADAVNPLTRWGMLTGAQGAYSMHFMRETNLPDLVIQGVYDDNGSNSAVFSNCYGTTAGIGILGAQALSGYCTDPYAGQASCSGGWYFTPSARLYFEGPGMTPAQAEVRDQWSRQPLMVTTAPH